MTFYVKVKVGDKVLECYVISNCKIVYKRDYTPVLYFTSPQVVYFGSEIDLWINPKNTLSITTDLIQNEK